MADDTAADRAVSRMEQPMFIIDPDRLIRLRNASGAALLSRRDLLLEQGGAVSCRHPDSDRRLDAAVRAMGNDSGDEQERRAVWLRRSDELTAAATLHALRGEGVRRSSIRLLLTVFEPGARKRADPELLAAAYRLTAAEARLAALIAEGYGTAHCARVLCVKTSTLRSHLAAIYRKTGAHGKADLVRLVLSLCAT